MTGGAQGQTGMWIPGSQSASDAPQVLMESLVFSSTFSSSQPSLLFFICYLVLLVHKDIHGVGADPGTPDSVLGPPATGQSQALSLTRDMEDEPGTASSHRPSAPTHRG